MSSTGTVLFAVGSIGILTGFVIAGIWSLDQLRDTDTRANQMISPSMPPAPPMGPPPPMFPPSPFSPPSPMPPPSAPPARRLLEEKSVFKFTADEEKKIMRDVRSSLLGMKH